ncbi:hypothetical protein KBC89_00290 [Candidatus Woesebacteria bacterium]|nr:hypothetical protein [Candidatus Woesebacteria bacterium]
MNLENKKKLYKIFLGIGIYGAADFIVGALASSVGMNPISGKGITSLVYALLFFLFGENIAASISAIPLMLSSTMVFWFGAAYLLNKGMRQKNS